MTPADHGKARTCTKLALLVGSNPLPNYLAAVALEARDVILLYTPETTDPRDRLRAVLAKRSVGVTDRCISDATNSRTVRDAWSDLDADHLYYSGGTKPMAAHARLSFKGGEEQVSYLDERRSVLRFEDGYDRPLDDIDFGLTLDVVFELHGIERVSAGTRGQGPTKDDAGKIAKAVLADPEVSKKLLDHFNPEVETGKRKNLSLTEAREKSFDFAAHGLWLTVAAVPGSDWTNKTYEPWRGFLCGTWLEVWAAAVFRECIGGSATEIGVGIDCKRNGTQFEIDIALLRGHRLYAISCTTDRRKGLCKSKLFEIAMRSRQMGGDLARSALVCLLDGRDDKGSFVEQLRSDIASVWDAPNTPRVFGLADLQEWAGTSGTPNLATLNRWLDS